MAAPTGAEVAKRRMACWTPLFGAGRFWNPSWAWLLATSMVMVPEPVWKMTFQLSVGGEDDGGRNQCVRATE